MREKIPNKKKLKITLQNYHPPLKVSGKILANFEVSEYAIQAEDQQTTSAYRSVYCLA